jgi:hypothetical protein
MSLTRSNLDAFVQNIPFSTLPKTFQHAVVVAREMGFEYLWIDSLCIVQGPDQDDWYSESGRMGGVYGGGGLNIAATGADHGGQGLFFDRDVNMVRACLVLVDDRRAEDVPQMATDQPDERTQHDAQEPERRNQTLTARPNNPARKLHYCIDGLLWERTFSLTLFSRAWVFQERYLSPRTLHFGPSQLFYECRTVKRFETLPFIRIDGDHEETLALTDFQREWSEVVKGYTKGKLTKATDKLVAISGIARVMEEKYGDGIGEYMVGLWRARLPGDLLWTVNSTCSARPLPLRAPTWSWASVDGEVSVNNSDILSTCCEILSIDVSSDPHTHSTSGTIKLPCSPLLTVTQMYESKTDPDFYFEFYRLVISELPQHDWELRCSFDNHSPEPSITAPIIPSKFYLLDVVQRSETAGTGLIIERVLGQKGYFRRIGRYLTGEDEFAAFREARSIQNPNDQEDELYESVERNEEDVGWKCVINLI